MTEIDYVKIFKALSDEMRLKILQEIAKHEEICVCKLMEKFAIAQSKLSYHLKFHYYLIPFYKYHFALGHNLI